MHMYVGRWEQRNDDFRLEPYLLRAGRPSLRTPERCSSQRSHLTITDLVFRRKVSFIKCVWHVLVACPSAQSTISPCERIRAIRKLFLGGFLACRNGSPFETKSGVRLASLGPKNQTVLVCYA